MKMCMLGFQILFGEFSRQEFTLQEEHCNVNIQKSNNTLCNTFGKYFRNICDAATTFIFINDSRHVSLYSGVYRTYFESIYLVKDTLFSCHSQPSPCLSNSILKVSVAQHSTVRKLFQVLPNVYEMNYEMLPKFFREAILGSVSGARTS